MQTRDTVRVVIAAALLVSFQSLWLWILLTWIQRKNLWVVTWCLICELMVIAVFAILLWRRRR